MEFDIELLLQVINDARDVFFDNSEQADAAFNDEELLKRMKNAVIHYINKQSGKGQILSAEQVIAYFKTLRFPEDVTRPGKDRCFDLVLAKALTQETERAGDYYTQKIWPILCRRSHKVDFDNFERMDQDDREFKYNASGFYIHLITGSNKNPTKRALRYRGIASFVTYLMYIYTTYLRDLSKFLAAKKRRVVPPIEQESLETVSQPAELFLLEPDEKEKGKRLLEFVHRFWEDQKKTLAERDLLRMRLIKIDHLSDGQAGQIFWETLKEYRSQRYSIQKKIVSRFKKAVKNSEFTNLTAAIDKLKVDEVIELLFYQELCESKQSEINGNNEAINKELKND